MHCESESSNKNRVNYENQTLYDYVYKIELQNKKINEIIYRHQNQCLNHSFSYFSTTHPFVNSINLLQLYNCIAIDISLKSYGVCSRKLAVASSHIDKLFEVSVLPVKTLVRFANISLSVQSKQQFGLQVRTHLYDSVGYLSPYFPTIHSFVNSINLL